MKVVHVATHGQIHQHYHVGCLQCAPVCVQLGKLKHEVRADQGMLAIPREESAVALSSSHPEGEHIYMGAEERLLAAPLGKEAAFHCEIW
jgi:hypothetical protein